MDNIKKRILSLIEKYESQETAFNERIRDFTNKPYFSGDDQLMMS